MTYLYEFQNQIQKVYRRQFCNLAKYIGSFASSTGRHSRHHEMFLNCE